MKVIVDNTELIGTGSEHDEIESTSVSSHGINHASHQESIKPAEYEQAEHIPEYIKSIKTGLYKLASDLGEQDLLDSQLQNKEYRIESRVLNFLIDLLSKYYDDGNHKSIKTCIFQNMRPIIVAQGVLVLTKENQTFLENKLVCDLENARTYAPTILRFADSKLEPKTAESLITLLEYYNKQLLNDSSIPNITHITYLLLNSNLEGDLLAKATNTLTSICTTTDSRLMGKLSGRLTSLVDSSLEQDIQLHDITGFILAKTATELFLDQEGEGKLKKDSRLASLNSIQKLLEHNQTICEQSMELLVENLRAADVSVITSTLKVFTLISKQNGYLSENAIYAASKLVTLEEKLVKEAAIDFLANVCSNSKYDYGKLIDPNLAPSLLEEVLSQNKQAAVLLNAILQVQEKEIGGLCPGYLGEDRYLELEKILAGSESSLEAKYIATLLIRQAVLEYNDRDLPKELLQVLSAAADNARSSDHTLSLYSIEVLKAYFIRPDSQLHNDKTYAILFSKYGKDGDLSCCCI